MEECREDGEQNHERSRPVSVARFAPIPTNITKISRDLDARGRARETGTEITHSFDRTNLSRIEANPDIPSYLRDNPHRFPWMLDRDRHGASFTDFDSAEYQAYLARQDEVDAEKDIEDGAAPHIWNIATTQPWNDPEFAPALGVDNMPAPFRYPIPHVGPGESWADGGPQPQVSGPELSEEDRTFLEEAKKKIDSGLSAADIAILEHLVEGQSLPAYGED